MWIDFGFLNVNQKTLGQSIQVGAVQQYTCIAKGSPQDYTENYKICKVQSQRVTSLYLIFCVMLHDRA